MDNNCSLDKYIYIDGNRIRYRILGDGDTCVMLIHGIGGYIEGWSYSPLLLSKHYKVVVLDMVGHGLSDRPDIIYSIDMFTEFVIDFMEVINIYSAVLVGHSIGGAICLNIAIKYHEKVKSLILVNSAGVTIPFGIRLGSLSILKKFDIKTSRFILKLFSRCSIYDKKFITKEWIDENHKFMNIKGSYRTMFSIIRSNINLLGLKKDIKIRFLSGIRNLKLPVLILCAANDMTVPKANSYQLHSQIPHSVFKIYEKCRHILPYERPDEFAEDVVSFLASEFK